MRGVSENQKLSLEFNIIVKLPRKAWGLNLRFIVKQLLSIIDQNYKYSTQMERETLSQQGSDCDQF